MARSVASISAIEHGRTVTAAHRESATLAQRLIETGSARALPGSSPFRANRRTPMTSKPVAPLLSDLGVTKSHSIPHVSNDNTYFEA